MPSCFLYFPGGVNRRGRRRRRRRRGRRGRRGRRRRRRRRRRAWAGTMHALTYAHYFVGTV